MRYQTPYLLWILPVVAVAATGALVALARNRRRLARLGDHHLVARMVASASIPRKVAKILLAAAGIALVTVAAARPQTGGSLVHTSREGIDMVVALDMSKSMLARDVGSSRLQAAAMELEMLLEQLPGSRIGLVPFAGTAFVQCPLTHDRNAIKGYLRQLRPEEMPVGGTTIGMAVSTGMKLLQSSKSKSKAILVFTDGEDHGEETMEISEEAAKAGIRIYTVGIGTETGDPIPNLDAEGNLIGYKKDDEGSYAYTRLDRSSLEKIAGKTGGSSYLWKNSGSVASSMAADLNNLEKIALGSTTRRVYDEQFHWLLLPGMALLLGELLLSDRRRTGRGAGSRGAGEVKGKGARSGLRRWLGLVKRRDDKHGVISARDGGGESSPRIGRGRPSPLVVLTICLSLLLANGAWTPFSKTMREVEEANSLIAEKNYAGALEKYTAGLDSLPRESPQYPALCQGAGVALFHLERYDEAEARFREGLKGNRISPQLRNQILKGLGATLFNKGQFKDARIAFTEALRLAPDDDAARHNLELSLLMEDPPCSYREDQYESNDTSDQAKSLQPPNPQGGLPGQGQGLGQSPGQVPGGSPGGHDNTLMLCENNDDWFKVHVPQGYNLFATAIVKHEGKPGDFAMELYDSPEGEIPVRQSLPAKAGDPGRVMVDLRNSPKDSTYFVRVTFDRKSPLHDLLVFDASDADNLKRLEELELELEQEQEQEEAHGAQGATDAATATDTARGATAPDTTSPLNQLGTWEEDQKEKASAYTLTLTVEPSCAIGDDNYEPNNTPETATPLSQGQHENLRICPGNEDYYLVKAATDDGPLHVTMKSDQARGKLLMALLEAETGVESARGDISSDTQTAGVESTEGKSFMVRVTGTASGETNSYKLTISDTPPDENSDENQDGEDGKDQEQEQDQDQDQEQEQKQDESGSDQDKQNQNQKDEKADQDQESGSSPKEEDNMQPGEPTMEHLLDSLTEEDRNLQLERAIEVTPPRRVNKDW